MSKILQLAIATLLGTVSLSAAGCNLGSGKESGNEGRTSGPIALSSADTGRTISGLNIDATGHDYGIKIEGAQNVVIENCQISYASEANLLIRGVSGITVRNCTFSGGIKSGIRVSSTAVSRNIVIEGNRISGAKQDGILVAVDEAKSIRHTGVVIRGNSIRSVASDGGWPGHYHGMYIQTPGYLITNNQVFDVYDGNGISVRAGGTIENNVVIRTGKNGISYFADHDSSSVTTLVISGNQVWETGRNTALTGGAPLALLELPTDGSRTSITKARLLDNRLGPMDAKSSLILKPSNPNYLTEGIEETGTTVLTQAPPE